MTSSYCVAVSFGSAAMDSAMHDVVLCKISLSSKVVCDLPILALSQASEHDRHSLCAWSGFIESFEPLHRISPCVTIDFSIICFADVVFRGITILLPDGSSTA